MIKHHIIARVAYFGRLFIALCICLCINISLYAQNDASGGIVAEKTLFLDTNFKEAYVFADTILVGRALDVELQIPYMTKVIRLTSPRINSWTIPPKEHVLESVQNDTLHLEINFPYYYQVETTPFNADIYLENDREKIFVGASPVSYSTLEPLEGQLVITQDGFEPVKLAPGNRVWNYHHVKLNKLKGSEVETFGYREKASKRWIDILAGGVAVGAGVMAIRYKTKANRRFNRYEENGDPSLRSGFERYDRYAAVSLGVMQAGIGVVALRFVLR